MFRVLCVAVYDLAKSRTKNPKHLTRNYFLTMGLIWGAFTFVLGALGQIRDLAAGEMTLSLYLKVIAAAPFAGFILGDIFGFIPWLFWFRHHDEMDFDDEITQEEKP